jgi:hypothetical protein
MARINVISLYWLLSAVNSSVPVAIALLFSIPGWGLLVIWALSTMVTFTLICLTCLRTTLEDVVLESEPQWARGEIQNILFL